MKNNPIEPEDLIPRLVAAVSDSRTDVDWDESEATATETHRGLVRQLRDLARIAAAIRGEGWQLDSVTAACDEEPSVPGRWGRLDIIDTIARGEFGDVFRARDPQLDREVALKLLRPRRSAATEFASFASEVVHEGRMLARVNHPNVARVFGAESHNGRVGVWMELIRGQDLEDLLAAQGRFAAEEAARIGQELCRALAAVHGAGVLHRDLKTRNVMREEGGRIVLTDFGTARELTDQAEAWDSTGTPLYMAPELFDGAPATARSDIYSLGVLLFRLVTGHCPVAGRNYDEVSRAHREGRRASLADLRPDLPEAFMRVIERAIAPHPDARYESAGAFERALAAVHGHTATGGPPSTTTSTAAGRLTRVLIGAVAGAVIIAGLLLAWRFWPGASYDIQAALWRVRGTSIEPLLPGATITPGDRLLLEVAGSVDLHVYVVSRDDLGEAYLLFPMSKSDLRNPIPAGGPHRLPGTRDGVQMAWTVTSSGGREHMVIVAAPHRLEDFEADLHDLDRPEGRRPDESGSLSGGAGIGADGSNDSHLYARVPDAALGRLRGIGGVSRQPLPASQTQANGIFKGIERLSTHAESVRGTWVRQIDLEYARP